MTLCLDTSVVIEIFRNRRPQFRERLNEAAQAGEAVWISSIVLHELMYGARISAAVERELELIAGFIGYAEVASWSAEDAVSAAEIRADLAAKGSTIAVMDALIAGQALNNASCLVTTNIKDFVQIPNLTIIDWSDPLQAREIDRKAWMPAHLRRPPKEDK